MDALISVQVEEGVVTACSQNWHLYNTDTIQDLYFSNRMEGVLWRLGNSDNLLRGKINDILSYGIEGKASEYEG